MCFVRRGTHTPIANRPVGAKASPVRPRGSEGGARNVPPAPAVWVRINKDGPIYLRLQSQMWTGLGPKGLAYLTPQDARSPNGPTGGDQRCWGSGKEHSQTAQFASATKHFGRDRAVAIAIHKQLWKRILGSPLAFVYQSLGHCHAFMTPAAKRQRHTPSFTSGRLTS
jgi:hypothetical protein